MYIAHRIVVLAIDILKRVSKTKLVHLRFTLVSEIYIFKYIVTNWSGQRYFVQKDGVMLILIHSQNIKINKIVLIS